MSLSRCNTEVPPVEDGGSTGLGGKTGGIPESGVEFGKNGILFGEPVGDGTGMGLIVGFGKRGVDVVGLKL